MATTAMGARAMCEHQSASVGATTTTGYVTDVEGSLSFWRRYLAISQVIYRDDTSGELCLRPCCNFVFGGDSVDKGSGDLRVLGDLVRLKHKYPDRVHLILGNRDINKMRVLAELDERQIARRSKLPVCYWQRSDHESTLEAFLDGLLAERVAAGGTGGNKHELHTAANKLKWMLAKTMGSPDAFEFRRRELGELQGLCASEVSDDDVVASFVSSLRVGGLMREYLRLGELAVVIGDSLFVHGGFSTPHSAGAAPCVPELGVEAAPSSTSAGEIADVRSWCSALNTFASAAVAAWDADPTQEAAQQQAQCSSGEAGPLWSETGGAACGGGLLHFGHGSVPGGKRMDTVVYANFLEDGHATPPPAEVQGFLRRSGIARVIVGHQPHGDAPSIMRLGGAQVGSADLEVITADTSFSAFTEWPGAPEAAASVKDACSEAGGGARGCAVAEVCVVQQAGQRSSRTFVHGRLSSGQGFGFWSDHAHVGRQTATGWWVKAALGQEEGEQQHFLLSRGKGYTVYNRVASADEVAAEMAAPSPKL